MTIVTQDEVEAELDRKIAEATRALGEMLTPTKAPRKRERAPGKSLEQLKAEHEAAIAEGRTEKGEIDEYVEALSKAKIEAKENLKRLRRQIDLAKEGKSEFVTCTPPGGWEGLGRRVFGLFTPAEIDSLIRALEIAAAFMSSARGGRKAYINETSGLDMTLSEYLRTLREEAENAEIALTAEAIKRGAHGNAGG